MPIPADVEIVNQRTVTLINRSGASTTSFVRLTFYVGRDHGPFVVDVPLEGFTRERAYAAIAGLVEEVSAVAKGL